MRSPQRGPRRRLVPALAIRPEALLSRAVSARSTRTRTGQA